VLTVSVGIATIFPKLDTTEAELIRAADRALYQAKANGRDRIYVFDDLANAPVSSEVLTGDALLTS